MRLLVHAGISRSLWTVGSTSKNTKKAIPLGMTFVLPSDVLLSQGETPNYHRR